MSQFTQHQTKLIALQNSMGILQVFQVHKTSHDLDFQFIIDTFKKTGNVTPQKTSGSIHVKLAANTN